VHGANSPRVRATAQKRLFQLISLLARSWCDDDDSKNPILTQDVQRAAGGLRQ
jgi:hypothetical protein